MKRRAIACALVPLVACFACAESGGPAWSRLPSSHASGEGTVSGAPASIPHAGHAPRIDGALDDAAWQHAATLGPFVDSGDGSNDHSGLAPSFARATWDEHALYLAFVVHDGSPAAPFARGDDDPHLWESASAVEVMLQPDARDDNRDYFEMQFDTAGAKFDTMWDDYNVPIHDGPSGRVFGHQEWSCDAQRAARVVGGSYAIELALPFRAFTKNGVPHAAARGATWRMNLYAFRDGQSVANAWSPIHGEGNFHFARRWGRIRFE